MKTQTPELTRLRHIVLDLDGTIYKGGHLFDCTIPFLDLLASLHIGHTFLTNNTSLAKADYVRKLSDFGIPADESRIYTPADSAIAYVRERHPEVARLGVLGTPSLCRQISEAGFHVGWDGPEAVIVGFDTTLDYFRLCRAAYFIGLGLPFIATHPDLVCPTDEPTVLVDCGAICACLTAATGRRPVVLGKPDPAILRSLCDRLKIAPAHVAMIGDRLYTDMAMAHAADALSVLVLTGETTLEQARSAPQPPDLIVTDLGAFGALLSGARGAEFGR
jgi:HAD superfamily hydrolase (TIGR01450 family)